jgi:hypothetical protein
MERSTYAQIIDNIRAELSNEQKSTEITDAMCKNWILAAEEEITQKIAVRDSWPLFLQNGVASYNFNDRPVVTGATNATPIVISSAAHGLSNGNYILMRDVLGNTNANGSFRVYGVATNAFSLYGYASISNATTDAASVITATAHGITNGQSVIIDGVLGTTSINTTAVATVIDANTFSIPVAGNAAYAGGGVVSHPMVGNAAYVSGGKYWLQNEIPSYLHDIDRISRLVGQFIRDIPVVELPNFVEAQVQDTSYGRVYSDIDAPMVAAIDISLSNRVLRFHQAPQSDNNATTLYGFIKIIPQNYTGDSYTTSIHLTSEYYSAILYYVLWRSYLWMKDKQTAAENKMLFESAIEQVEQSAPTHVRKIVRFK